LVDRGDPVPHAEDNVDLAVLEVGLREPFRMPHPRREAGPDEGSEHPVDVARDDVHVEVLHRPEHARVEVHREVSTDREWHARRLARGERAVEDLRLPFGYLEEWPWLRLAYAYLTALPCGCGHRWAHALVRVVARRRLGRPRPADGLRRGPAV